VDDWWTEFDNAVLDCLAGKGPLAPAEIGRRLGISETATTSILMMLAQESKIRICLVEALADEGPSGKEVWTGVTDRRLPGVPLKGGTHQKRKKRTGHGDRVT
jgi:hypothetical protein